MDKVNEVSNWQLGEKYFDYLNDKLKNIDLGLNYLNYDVAFNELSQIFFHIHKVIEDNKKTNTRHGKILLQIEKVNVLLIKYNYLLISTTMPSYMKSRKIIDARAELRHEVEELYKLMTGVLYDLNMLLPKKREYDGPQIYQQ
jgi:F0F1-type ATP synthase gamma subunit